MYLSLARQVRSRQVRPRLVPPLPGFPWCLEGPPEKTEGWGWFVRSLLAQVRSARSLSDRLSRLVVWSAVQFLPRGAAVIAPPPERRRATALLQAAMQAAWLYLLHRPVSVSEV